MTRRSLFMAPLALLAGLLPVKWHSLSNGFYRLAVGHVCPPDGFYVPPLFASEIRQAIKPEVLMLFAKGQMDDILPKSQYIIRDLCTSQVS